MLGVGLHGGEAALVDLVGLGLVEQDEQLVGRAVEHLEHQSHHVLVPVEVLYKPTTNKGVALFNRPCSDRLRGQN